ncbi:MAG: ribosome biogenesis GTP-binding protein YihA/YsxC [Thermodesulfobacteriota bacterium]
MSTNRDSDNTRLAFDDIRFLISVHSLSQLPPAEYPEIAFAGRSNVGKSSLINKLMGRKSMVKVSGRPGKTQGLNYFLVDELFYLVDLPGYGYAKVSRNMQDQWQKLITSYLEQRESLSCVVVIMDLRHEAKPQDRQLLGWLRDQNIATLPVYTKKDKLSGNQCAKNAARLDSGHGLKPSERILFSAKTGEGRDELERALASFTKIV